MQNPFFLCFLFPCGTSSLERRQAARVHAGTSSIPSAAPSPQPCVCSQPRLHLLVPVPVLPNHEITRLPLNTLLQMRTPEKMQ